MRFGVVGINHKQANLRLRELVAKSCAARFKASLEIEPHQFLLVSTCNRTEIYFSSYDPAQTQRCVISLLRQELNEEILQKFYSFFDNDCFEHLVRVTAGLDSAIIGETEIQGQIKQAYEAAREYKLSSELHFLFQKSLQCAKKVRSCLHLHPGLPDMETAILEAARQIFTPLEKCRVLFVGASEINRKVLNHFKEQGLKEITLCNRTTERALLLTKGGVEIAPWSHLTSWTTYDIVIFGTRCPNYLLTLDHLSATLNSQKLIIDLSVPRNVEPALNRHPQITLFNSEAIQREVERRRKLNAQLLNQMDQLISFLVSNTLCLREQRELAVAEYRI